MLLLAITAAAAVHSAPISAPVHTVAARTPVVDVERRVKRVPETPLLENEKPRCTFIRYLYISAIPIAQQVPCNAAYLRDGFTGLLPSRPPNP